jgi:hypothetical protein
MPTSFASAAHKVTSVLPASSDRLTVADFMPADMSKDGLAIEKYFDCRELMAWAAQQLRAEKIGPNADKVVPAPIRVAPENYAEKLRGSGIVIGRNDNVSMTELTVDQLNSQRKDTRFRLLHVTSDKPSESYWVAVAAAKTGRLIRDSIKLVIKADGKGGYYAVTPTGAKITDAVTFAGHQTFGGYAVADAMKDGERYHGMVYGTGTGKSYIMIALALATGQGGVFAVPNEAQINQLKADILTLDPDVGDGGIVTSEQIAPGKEAEFLLNHRLGKPKYIIVSHNDLKRFANADVAKVFSSNSSKGSTSKFDGLSPDFLKSILNDVPWFVDEAHEASPQALEKLRDGYLLRNPDGKTPPNGCQILAITATWIERLDKIFGEPRVKLDLHYALKELRAFREIKIDAIGVESENIDDQVFAFLTDYYGTLTHIEEDNTPESDQKYISMKNISVHPAVAAFRRKSMDGVAEKILARNEVARYEQINMAFMKDPVLLAAVAKAYQQVHDGTYPRLEDLTVQASEMRAATRIRALWRIENEISKHALTPPVPKTIDFNDDYVQEHFQKMIPPHLRHDRTADASWQQVDLPEEARKTLRSKIANVLTRKLVGTFFDSSPNLVRADQVAGTLEGKLTALAKEAAGSKLDPSHSALLTAANDPNSDVHRRLCKLLAPLADKEKILEDLKAGKISSLIISEDSINIVQFPEASYATFVPPGDSEEAARTASRINEGLHVQIIGDSELATGYSNSDILSVQRGIANSIVEAIIRATQMLGRCMRAKDRIAFATDIVLGPLARFLNKNLEDGRPFLMKDVASELFSDLTKIYSRRFTGGRQAHALRPEKRRAHQPKTAQRLTA